LVNSLWRIIIEIARWEDRSDFFVIQAGICKISSSIFICGVSRCSTCGTSKCQTILSIAYRWFCLRTRKRSRPGLWGHSLYSYTNTSSRGGTPLVLCFAEYRGVSQRTVRRYWELSRYKKLTMPNTENCKTVLS